MLYTCISIFIQLQLKMFYSNYYPCIPNFSTPAATLFNNNRRDRLVSKLIIIYLAIISCELGLSNNCSQICAVINDSKVCSCDKGFNLAGDNHTCDGKYYSRLLLTYRYRNINNVKSIS